MKIKRRFSSAVEYRDEASTMAGTAAVFYDGTPETEFELPQTVEGKRAVERIMPGFFDDVLEKDVRALFNHDSSQVLGRNAAGTLHLRVSASGLEYEIDPPDTQLGRDLPVLMQRGDITGSSFGFVIGDQQIVEESDRFIRNLTRAENLIDISIVTFPAYEGTTSTMRSSMDQVLLDDFTEAIRDSRAANHGAPASHHGELSSQPDFNSMEKMRLRLAEAHN